MLDLSDVSLFEDLLSLNIDSRTIDLHNDFTSTSLKYSHDSRDIIIEFFKLNSDDSIYLAFIEGTFLELDVDFVSSAGAFVLANFNRGRCILDGDLRDHGTNGEKFYYLEFQFGGKVTIQSKKLVLFESALEYQSCHNNTGGN